MLLIFIIIFGYSMNRAKTSPSKGKLPFKFNAKSYVKPGLTEADIL